MQRLVVLVDKNDQELGTAEIFKVHQGKGLKHRALSVVLYRPTSSTTSTLRSGELRSGAALGVKKSFEVLLQKRAEGKPVFRRLWGNACCTNLRPGDEYIPRAVSRLREEMGIEIEEKDLQILYRFSYEALDPTRAGWCENELDTALMGEWSGEVKPNPEEVEDYKWIEWEDLKKEMENNPNEYAPWLKMIVEDGRVEKNITKKREAMNDLGVRVPGKVIITGEHAVVYGKLALAASLDMGVRVGVEKMEGGEWQEYRKDKKGLIKKAIELAGGDETIGVKIESELPMGSGLGSSAAIGAAVIKGVREYLGKPITSEELFKLTMEVEKVAHGNPSGVDPATVVYGGLIGYTKGQPIERLKVLKPFTVLLVNSGKPRESTKEMVELVANNNTKEQIIEEMGEISRKVRDKLVEGGEIFELINENGLLLEQLGIVGERARLLSDELRKDGSAVKITGAGGVKTGSGMLMVVAKDLEKTKRLLDNRKVQYIETVIGER